MAYKLLTGGKTFVFSFLLYRGAVKSVRNVRITFKLEGTRTPESQAKEFADWFVSNTGGRCQGRLISFREVKGYYVPDPAPMLDVGEHYSTGLIVCKNATDQRLKQFVAIPFLPDGITQDQVQTIADNLNNTFSLALPLKIPDVTAPEIWMDTEEVRAVSVKRVNSLRGGTDTSNNTPGDYGADGGLD